VDEFDENQEMNLEHKKSCTPTFTLSHWFSFSVCRSI